MDWYPTCDRQVGLPGAQLVPVRRVWTLAVAVAVLASGCTTPPQVTPSVETPQASAAPVPASAAATQSPAPAPLWPQLEPQFVEDGMPSPDGGPMLWPLPWDDGAWNPDAWGPDPEFHTSIVRYGFINESAKIVVSPRYAEYAYCFKGGRPSRVVAAREHAIDVLTLGGTVVRTIATAREQSPLTAVLECVNDTSIVWAASSEGRTEWQEVYSLSTGTRLSRAEKPGGLCAEGPGYSDGPTPDPAATPTGTADHVGGGWTLNAAGTVYTNEETQATVAAEVASDPAAPVLTLSECAGAELGFLSCQLGQGMGILFDRRGQVTPFGGLGAPSAGTTVLNTDQPCNITVPPRYAWTTTGTYQGYIDGDGNWRYREPLRKTLKD